MALASAPAVWPLHCFVVSVFRDCCTRSRTVARAANADIKNKNSDNHDAHDAGNNDDDDSGSGGGGDEDGDGDDNNIDDYGDDDDNAEYDKDGNAILLAPLRRLCTLEISYKRRRMVVPWRGQHRNLRGGIEPPL